MRIRRFYMRIKKVTAVTMLIALNLTLIPLGDLAFEQVTHTSAAQIVNTTVQPKQGPFIQCPGYSGDCSQHWTGNGQQSPQLVVDNLVAGEVVRVSNIKGSIEWGGGQGEMLNPHTCRDGGSEQANRIPKHAVIAQFTNNSNQVIAPAGVSTPSNRGAPLLRDFEGGITVPQGATRMWVSYTDSRYDDNNGSCSFTVTVDPTTNGTPVGTDNDAKCWEISAPKNVAPGEQFQATVRMKNTGDTVWNTAEGYRLGTTNPNDHVRWGFHRVELPTSVEPGETATFNFTATAPYTEIGKLSFDWEMLRENVERFGNACTKTINVEKGDALFIDKTAPETVEPGQRISYSIVVRNDKQLVAQGVRLHDVIPAGLQYIAQESTPGCYQDVFDGHAIVNCPIGTLAQNQTYSATITFAVPATADCGGRIVNQADVHADNIQSGWDKAMTDVECPAPKEDGAKCLDISAPHSVLPGQQFQATVKMKNTGDTVWTAAEQYRLGSETPRDNVRWGLHRSELPSTINPGDTATFVFNAVAPQELGTYDFDWGMLKENIAWFGSICKKDITVKKGPKLEVDKEGPETIKPGETITYTLTARNTSDVAAQNVTLADVFPTDTLTFLSYASTPGCFLADQSAVHCPVGTLAPGQTYSVQVAFLVAESAQCDSTITNQSDIHSTTHELNWDKTMTRVKCVAALVNNAKCLDISAPDTVKAGALFQATVKMKNTGTTTWKSENGYALGAESPRDNIRWGLYRTALPGVIEPNNTATFTFSAVAPQTPGSYDFDWGMVQDHVEWFGSICKKDIEVEGTPALAIEKHGAESAAPGEVIRYTLRVTNTGNGPAKNVVIHDDNPAELEFVSASSGCSQQGDDVVCSVGSLAPQQSVDKWIEFRIPDTLACNAMFHNDAEAAADEVSPVFASVFSIVKCNPILQVTKEAPSTVKAGEAIRYNFTVRNTGNVQATNVVLTDIFPSSLQYSDANADCSVQGGSVVCQLGNLAKGSTKNLWMDFAVSDYQQCDTHLQNDVEVRANNSLPAYDSARTTVLCPEADVSIKKSGPSSVKADETISYTLTVKNNGPDTAKNVIVKDAIPYGLQFDASGSDSACQEQFGEIVCSIGDLAKGASKNLTLKFTATEHAQCDAYVKNVAFVYTDTRDPNGANNQSNEVSTYIKCPPPPKADLSITKEGPAKVLQGGTIVYTLKVKNAGPDTAENVSVQDVLPQGVSFDALSSSPECSLAFNGITCGSFTLASGQSKTLTIAANVSHYAECNEYIRNIASVHSTTEDPKQSNNTSNEVKTKVECPVPDKADLAVTKNGPASIVRGNILTYAVSVTNLGPAAATDVVVTDTVPNGLTFNAQQSSPGCFLNGNDVLCEVSTLASGQNKTFSLAFNVPQTAECESVIKNKASVTNTVTDPNHDNNVTPYVHTTVTCLAGEDKADLSIQKAGPATIERGDTIVYKLSVANNGPDTATNITVTDQIPAGLTFKASESDSACQQNGNTVVCSAASLDALKVKTYTLAFTVPETAQCDSIIHNVASVTSVTIDPYNGNNQSNVVTSVVCPAPTFAISKTDNRTVVKPGETLTYEVTVTNTSAYDATHTVVQDVLPSFVTFISASDNANQNGQIITWSNISLDAGQSKTFTVKAMVNAFTASGTVLLNTATVVGGPSATDTTTVTVDAPILGCIDVIKEAFDTNTNLITPVPQFTFTLDGVHTASNDSTGRTRFNNVPAGTHTITELVPATWTQLSVTPANGVVTVGEGENCSTVLFKNKQVLTQSPTFAISKTDNRTTVARGETLTYEITVTNTSSVDATNVSVQDILPSALTFVSASDAGSISNHTITWTNLSFAAGQTKTLTVQATVKQDAVQGSNLVNTATVVGGPSAIDTTVIEQIVVNPTFSITKTDNRTTVTRGETLVYSITVTNTSTVSASGVTIQDSLPPSVTFVSASDAGTANGQVITWNNQQFAAGQSKTFTVQATVKQDAVQGSTLVNTATVVGGPSATDTTTVTVEQEIYGCIDVIKEAFDTNNNVITPVPQFTFTLDGSQTAVSNGNGRATFNNVSVGTHSVTETIPATWTQLSVTPANGSVTVSAGSTCATVIFKNRQQLTNNNGQATFTISKTDNRQTAKPGDVLTYTITVTNTSSYSASGVTVTDVLPSTLTSVSATNGTVNGQTVTWTNQNFSAGQSRTFTVSGTVSNTATYGMVLTNIAYVANATATDSTMIITNNQPPIYPPYQPPVYPPYQPPVQPPYQPPYIPPTQPPYQPPIGQPKPYPYPPPQTGENVVTVAYTDTRNGEVYLAPAVQEQAENGFINYVTILATTLAGIATAGTSFIVKVI